QCPWTDEYLLLNHNRVEFAFKVSNDHCANADESSILDCHQLRGRGFNNGIVTDKNIVADMHTSPPVKQRPKSSRPDKVTGEELKDATKMLVCPVPHRLCSGHSTNDWPQDPFQPAPLSR